MVTPTCGHDDLAALAERVPLHPIRDAADYDAAVRVMNGLLDAGAGEEGHPLAGLLDRLGGFIGDHDDAQHPLSVATPAEIRRLLMEQHGLRQGDLPEIGSQGWSRKS